MLKRMTAVILTVILLLSSFTRAYALDDTQRTGEDLAIERMIRGFENFEESIDLSDLNITITSLPILFSHATKNAPYLFYVDKKLTYTYRGDTVIAVMPKYNMTKSEAEKAIEYCKDEVGKMARLVLTGEGELERLILAHDLLCARFKYDLSLESNNIYKFIKEGKGTCQGYTWTYMALLRELGIECEYVASDSIDHIWLLVKIEGEWYHSDVTWDDPVGGEEKGAPISRRHLLFSDSKAEADGYRDRYGTGENKCTSEKYDGADLSGQVSPNHTSGDVDHDGKVGLSDLMTSILKRSACPICSDVNVDMIVDCRDVEALRELILTNFE